jgi:hypothetical protein
MSTMCTRSMKWSNLVWQFLKLQTLTF